MTQLNMFNSNLKQLLELRCNLQNRMDYYLHVANDRQRYETCFSQLKKINNQIQNHYKKENKWL